VAYGFGIGRRSRSGRAAFSDVFGGHKTSGAIFGVIAVAYPVGGIIVMNVGSIFYDRIGNYWPVYGVVMASLLAGSVALVIAGPAPATACERGSCPRQGEAAGLGSGRPPAPSKAADAPGGARPTWTATVREDSAQKANSMPMLSMVVVTDEKKTIVPKRAELEASRDAHCPSRGPCTGG